ncbi:MAG: ChaN family lipoprotein [Gammaproteobacteria bacterium]|nr:ChaN family lipoprotein [Gammaproteobacteria bacterium]
MPGLRILTLLASLSFVSTSFANGECHSQVGQWLDPASGDVLDSRDLLDDVSGKARVVLLGESHTTAAHHRWQAYMLAALHARNPDMAVGFEMLPRSAQPVLDDWSRGTLTEAQLLARSNWQTAWGYDADYYLPLFHFTRLHQLPTLALNVDRGLVSRVGREGWDAIEPAAREGVSDPAPASAAYRNSLADLFLYKRSMGAAHGSVDDEERREVMRSAEFLRFVEAQLTWDRAMAEILAQAHRRNPQGLVVGIVGRGHAEFGRGIPHQLADLGIDEVQVLLPWAAAGSCGDMPAGIADAVFVVDEALEDPPAPRPQLGVMIEPADDGVRVAQVVAGSVAEQSGLEAGDVIRRAAGFPTASVAELIEIIRRQAPGTWLPLEVLRENEAVEITARFPQRFE